MSRWEVQRLDGFLGWVTYASYETKSQAEDRMETTKIAISIAIPDGKLRVVESRDDVVQGEKYASL